MKKFLYTFFYFILPIIILAYPLDLLLSNNLKKSNTYAQEEYTVWNDIYNGKADADIIIAGSSRAWVNFNSTMITDSLNIKTYNLGVDGHNFWLQNFRYETYLKYNRKPKLIIYSLDINTLDKREDLYNGDQFLPYMLWNTDIENAIKSYEGYYYFDNKIPLLRFVGNYSSVKEAIRMIVEGKDNHITRIKGYEGQNATWNSDFENAKKTKKKLIAKFDNLTIKLFEKFIKECKINNIEIVFVYTPEYIEGQQFVENRTELFRHFSYFINKYHIPFYDFSNDSISYDKKYFYNVTHLNKNGAELFTEKLIDSLKILKQIKSISKK